MPLSDIQRAKSWKEIALKFQEDKFSRNFEDNIGLYEGRVAEPMMTQDRPFKTNLVKPIVDSNISSLFARNPRVVLSPLRSTYKLGGGRVVDGIRVAKNMEEIINHTIYDQNLMTTWLRVLRDVELGGYTATESGWLSNIDRESVMVDGDKQEVNIAYKDWARPKTTFTTRRDPRQFLFPPYAMDLNNLPWLFFWEDVPVDEVVSEPNFDKKATTDLKRRLGKGQVRIPESINSNMNLSVLGRRNAGRMMDFGFVRVYHWWNLKEKMYCVFADGVDEFLRVEDWDSVMGKVEGYPFDFLWYTEGYDCVYPIAPVEDYKSKAIEMQRLRLRMLDAVDKAKDIMLAGKSENREDLQKLAEAEMGAIVELMNPGGVSKVSINLLNQSLVDFYTMMNYDLQIEAQTSETRLGASSTEDKATGMIQREQALAIKESRKKAMLNDYMKRWARKQIQFWQDNMDETMSLRISQETGGFSFKEFSKYEIQGEFDINVDVESTALATPAREVQNMRGVLELAAMAPGEIDTRKVIAKILKSQKIEPTDVMRQPNNIDAIKLAEVEWNQMTQGVDVQPSEGEDHAAHMNVHLRQMNELQVLQRQDPASITPDLTLGAEKLVQHIAWTEELMTPQGVLQSPTRTIRNRGVSGTQGNRTVESETSTVSTPVGMALSRTTEAARNTAERTP